MNHLIKQAEELAQQRAGGQVPVGLEKKPIIVIHMVPVYFWNHHAGTANGVVSVLPKPYGKVSGISHGFCIQNGFLTPEPPCRYSKRHGFCSPEASRYSKRHGFITPETSRYSNGMVSSLVKPAGKVNGNQ
jgi:hypothetical protein